MSARALQACSRENDVKSSLPLYFFTQFARDFQYDSTIQHLWMGFRHMVRLRNIERWSTGGGNPSLYDNPIS
jgi:hypothetical protein